ncbi:NADP(+)-dependent dehydrogenase [Talaromyces proteolyticus]|uniref:NADP(+)-dependent dehydrogenase n=1 Tax=Talaromyces proteolyticus TaxID=1131652 RepID=A0AAD4Q4X5_9EURO|nr:NADP(+)-dependent dehydrogenase [Talaromyces proteolyticus]KAH8703716.1 NADP(+)-dependent dehydrogenase [Talaromyces proteolyticus]
MPFSLKGKRVLVTAGSRGLGAEICQKFAEEGCNVAINYYTNVEAAQSLANRLIEEYSVKACIIKGDTTVAEDNERLINETKANFGGLDVVIANAGWTRFAKPGDIYDLSIDEWNTCWNANVLSHLQLMQAAKPILEQNPEGGAYILTSSITGITPAGSSIGYSVTKSAALHLMKHFAFCFGPKIRVNAVLPGILLTDQGKKFGDAQIKNLQEKAALKHETYLDDCADVYVSLSKNTSITGQQIVVDSGLVMGGLPKQK